VSVPGPRSGHERPTRELLPPPLRLPIVPDEIALAHPARGAEIQLARGHPAIEVHGGIAQRAEGHGHRGVPRAVIDDLVIDQHLQGVGAGVARYLQGDDRLARIQPRIRPARWDEPWLIGGRDAVLGRATGAEFAQRRRVVQELDPYGPSWPLPFMGNADTQRWLEALALHVVRRSGMGRRICARMVSVKGRIGPDNNDKPGRLQKCGRIRVIREQDGL
jgi:hypothetical protein